MPNQSSGLVADSTARITASTLPIECQTHIFEKIIAGLDDKAIAEMLIEEGVLPSLAYKEIVRVRAHPFTGASERLAAYMRRLESLLTVKHTLLNMDYRVYRVERRAAVARAEFLQEYYAANRPIILTGILQNSPAEERWTPEYIAEACGEALVEVMSGRDSDPQYEVRSDSHKTTVTLSAYIEQIISNGPGNDKYLVANNHFFDRPETDILREEVPQLPEYIDAEKSAGSVFLWFGPAGTITPLHYDVMNVLVAQIRGRKRFTLFSPEQTPWLYNDIGVYSEIDPERPAFERYPLFRNARALPVDLHPGEVLFLPVGWWHHVRALDLSIMVSYTNFVFPNDFRWVNRSMT